MLENIPSEQAIIDLLGEPLYEFWKKLCLSIEENFHVEKLCKCGGKKWSYEQRYKQGRKILCTLYAKNKSFGLLIVFSGKDRRKFESIRGTLPDTICKKYDNAKLYYDGKSVMFEPTDISEFDDYMGLLALKRKS